MAAITTAQAGDWADTATWVGGVVPTVGDTATIFHDVTVTTSVSVDGITLNEVLAISGTLTLNGNVSCALSGWRLEVQAGGTLDLAGFTITPIAAGEYRFQGTSVNRAAVTSSAAAGVFGAPGVNVVTANFTYCDFDNIGGTLGRTQTSAIVQVCTYCTFTNCTTFDIDVTGTNAAAGFIIEYNKVTDWASATPVASNSYALGILQTAASPTATRRFRFNVLDNSTNASAGLLRIRANRVDFSDNILNEVVLETASSPTYTVACNKNFWSMPVTQDVLRIAGTLSEFCGNYIHFPQGGHILTPGSTINLPICGNIWDIDGASAKGMNAVLFTSALSGNVKISSNIQIGEGNQLAFTVNPSGGSIQFRKNTNNTDNEGTLGSGQFFSPWMITEQLATNVSPAAMEFWDNLLYDPNDNNTQDAAIDLIGATADQIDLVDYNCGWGVPNGSYTFSFVNVTITGGVGANDFSLDPQFVAVGRDLAAWDASLGGPGTSSNAVAELKKRNDSDWDSRYEVGALLKWVAAGYQPQNAAVQAGRHGGSAGAGALKKTVAVPLVSWAGSRA
jgi:hypothetical protein